MKPGIKSKFLLLIIVVFFLNLAAYGVYFVFLAEPSLIKVIFLFLLMSASLILIVLHVNHSIIKPIVIIQSLFQNVNRKSGIASNHSIARKDEIGELFKDFNNMIKRLDKEQMQQIEIVSSISHDINNPLTSIIASVERLTSKINTEEKRQEYYHIILEKAVDIKLLAAELNSYIQNEMECSEFKTKIINASEFLDALCEEYTRDLVEHDASLVCENLIPKDVFIDADLNKLRRVFSNVMDNSIKYVEKPVRINIKAFMEDKFVHFRIEDNGSGIPESEQDKIFNSFYRIDKSRSREKGGTGLGLSICQKIINNYGGSINAYKTGNGGLGIVFSLPVFNGLNFYKYFY